MHKIHLAATKSMLNPILETSNAKTNLDGSHEFVNGIKVAVINWPTLTETFHAVHSSIYLPKQTLLTFVFHVCQNKN